MENINKHLIKFSKRAEKVDHKTLVDTFIIVLHSAEMLHMELESFLKDKLEIDRDLSVPELTEILKENSPDLYATLNVTDEKDKVLNLMLKDS